MRIHRAIVKTKKWHVEVVLILYPLFRLKACFLPAFFTRPGEHESTRSRMEAGWLNVSPDGPQRPYACVLNASGL